MTVHVKKGALAGDPLSKSKHIGQGFGQGNNNTAPTKKQRNPGEREKNARRRASRRQGGRPKPDYVKRRAPELFNVDPETGALTYRQTHGRALAGSRAGSISPDGYRVIFIDYWPYRASHIVWLLQTGDLPPDGMLIDHRDGNRANDAWGNLRLATYAQNAWNRKDKRKSAGGRRGVYKIAPGKWEASIICNGKTIRLGRFTDRGEAIKAREAGERAAYGEFARAA